MRIFHINSIMQMSLITLYCILPLIDLFLNSYYTDDNIIRNSNVNNGSAAILMEAFSSIEPQNKEKPFPYLMTFPFNGNSLWIYPFLYFSTAYGGIVAVTTMFSTDSVLGFYTTYACGQFELLQQDTLKIVPNGYDSIMKSIGSLNNSKLEEKLVQEEYCRRLRMVISRYNVLIKWVLFVPFLLPYGSFLNSFLCFYSSCRFCYLVNKLMSPMLFVNITVSQFLICAVLFQVVSMVSFILFS